VPFSVGDESIDVETVSENLSKRYFTCDDHGSGHRDCRFSAPGITAAEDNWAVMNVLLGAWSRFSRKHQIQSWAAHGTLLGWNCGQTIMDFDDDIDFEVSKKTLVYLLAPLNQTVFEGRFLLDVNPLGIFWHAKLAPKNVIDAIFIDMNGGRKVDITAFGIRPDFEEGTSKKIGANDGHVMSLEDLIPIRNSLLDGHDVNVPHAPENILRVEYGDKGVDCLPYKSHTFNGVEWESQSMQPRSNRLPINAFMTNATPFWIPWSDRRRFAVDPLTQNAEDLNKKIQSQLSSVDLDNTIAKPIQAPNHTIHVVEFNVQRGVHWKRACDLIRTDGVPDVVFLNEVDWGMSRSNNEHTTRRMAFELGLNYAWGIEFLELGPGNQAETEKAASAKDCSNGRRGTGFSGKVDALGLTGNAILSRYPLRNVTVSRSPGISRLYGVKSDLTAEGYELRLGGRMTLYATIVLNDVNIHLGCFHHQMKWDQRFPDAFQAVGKPTLDIMRKKIDAMDVSRQEIFLLGGDGWGTKWCNELGIPNLHDYMSGDWLCGRGVTGGNFRRIPSGDISDHDMFSIIVRPSLKNN